jgi:hypothetical protein
MKKYIREMIDDLRRKKPRGFVPPIPKPSTKAAEIDLGKAPAPPLPGDLNNQELSKKPLERARQLDDQAQLDERRETNS